MTLTALPCDTDPADATELEPAWSATYLTAFARIDENTTPRAECVIDPVNGARILRVTLISEQGGMLTLEMSNAGQESLAAAIAAAKVKADS